MDIMIVGNMVLTIVLVVSLILVFRHKSSNQQQQPVNSRVLITPPIVTLPNTTSPVTTSPSPSFTKFTSNGKTYVINNSNSVISQITFYFTQKIDSSTNYLGKTYTLHISSVSSPSGIPIPLVVSGAVSFNQSAIGLSGESVPILDTILSQTIDQVAFYKPFTWVQPIKPGQAYEIYNDVLSELVVTSVL
jgi:hypothetical protein